MSGTMLDNYDTLNMCTFILYQVVVLVPSLEIAILKTFLSSLKLLELLSEFEIILR